MSGKLDAVSNDFTSQLERGRIRPPTADWRATARRQGGTILRSQLESAGLSPSAVARMAGRAEIEVVARGVYLVGGAPLTYRSRLWLAVLSTRGALCGVTAGELWGLLARRRGPVHVTVPHSRRLVPPVDVALTRWRERAVPTCEHEGLPVTTARWTAMSLLAQLPGWEAARLADRALQRGWIVRGDLLDRLRRYPHRRGNPQLRALLDATADGAAAESERRLHRILHGAEISGWTANHAVWVGGDLVAVLDVAFVEQRVAVEVDGMAYHIDVDRFRHDRRRQNQLVTLGWTVLRFTWADLTERPAYVLHTVRRLTGLGRVSFA